MSSSTPVLKGAAPIYSMTGFARYRGRINDAVGWTLTLKSVNHRFLDLHMRMPGGSETLEMQLRRLLKANVLRGHLEVTLMIERASQQQVEMDQAMIASYLSAFRATALEHRLREIPDLSTLVHLPGVLRTGAQANGGNPAPEVRAAEMEQLEASVLQSLPQALSAFQLMRAQEGAALAVELNGIADRIAALVARVSALHGPMQQAHFERTSARIHALLGAAVPGAIADRDRLLQEAAILADRSDVTEELARLRAHIDHFRQMLNAGGELGKKLDFLLQEMNREANTMLSKTSGVAGSGTDVTEIGLGLKSEIEKAREQVQNLE